MNASYARRALQSTVAQVLAGTRDITSPNLSSYLAAIPGSQRRVAERYAVVSDYRTTRQLPTVTPNQFGQDQTPSGGTAFFVRAQTGQGIEEVFAEDLTFSDVYSNAPTHLAGAIAAISRKITPDTVALDSKLNFTANPSSLHLTEGPPPSVADDDSLTYRRLQQAFQYTRTLIK